MDASAGRLVTITVFITLFVTMCAARSVKGSPRCRHNPTPDDKLRFEDTANYEFAIDKQYKVLSCYAENFCTITWTKDGRPIDKDALTDEGQRLRFKSVDVEDAGLYTCQASRNGQSIQQDIILEIIKDCNKNLLPINIQSPGCKNASANKGDNVTFHCEFFVGFESQWLMENWFKFNESYHFNASMIDQDKWIQNLPLLPEDTRQGTGFKASSYSAKMKDDDTNNCDCGCKPIFVVDFQITNVSDFAYGKYALNVNKDGAYIWIYLTLTDVPTVPYPDISPQEMHRIVSIPVVVVLLVICILVILYRCKMDIKLWHKDHFETAEKGQKKHDVYLSYDWNSETDRTFAMGLVTYLEDSGYKVFCEINCLPGGDTVEDIYKALETSRRVVLIFSPDYLASTRNFDVIFSMDRAKNYKKEIIPIIYRDISTEEHQSPLVKHVLSRHCLRFDQMTTQPPNLVKKMVHGIMGDPRSEKSLHKELLLRLPTRHSTSKNPATAPGNNFISSEVPPYISSRQSMDLYNSTDICEVPEEHLQVFCTGDHTLPSQFVDSGINTHASRLYPSLYEL